MKTKDRCGRGGGKAGMSLKTKVVTGRKAGILLKINSLSVVAIALPGGILGAVGAKTTYGFIHITSTKGKTFGLIYALGVALLAAYGTWMLFAGSSASRTWMKVTRVVVTLLGGLAGLASGFGFYIAAGYVMNQGGFLADFGVNYGTVALGLGISAGVSLISALLPALRASRMSIADALRYTG